MKENNTCPYIDSCGFCYKCEPREEWTKYCNKYMELKENEKER